MSKLLLILIRFYQKINQQFFLPSCRFYPSCSCYALNAIKKYGAFRGTIMAFLRILRCSPLSSGGYDPVR